MKLTYLKVQNFRALDDIEIRFGEIANIICGPNASGKSTIFDAIRLVRAVLAPRLQNEGQTVLVQMQAVSQHYPQAGILMDALTGDHSKPLLIEAHFKLDTPEIAQLPSAKQALATSLLQQQLANNQQNPLDIVSLLSTPQGKTMFAAAEASIDNALASVLDQGICKLRLEMQPGKGFIPSTDFIGPLIVATLERALPFNLALMSFFPADRALPPGEVNIQLGGPDASQLIQSHALLPQSKYSRLKQTIVNSRVAPYPGAVDVAATFERIFESLLIGRKLEAIRVTPVGQVNIPIRDIKTNRIFDIDYLSSGEKGLILTFLLMVTSVATNGIILIDEPELHLNPALCRRLLPFLIDECLVPFGRQAIICSHSPEILASAFDDARCNLFNLVNPRLISPILSGDKDDLFGALGALGASLDDILFSRGTVYVEGKDDEKILMEAMSSELSKLKIVQMSGRANVEKEIQNIQGLDTDGKVDTFHYFIFDLDRKPTSLGSSQHVRVLQWDRTCIENFLLDPNAIYDVVQEEDVNSGAPPKRRGDVQSLIKSLQDQQILEQSISGAYQDFAYENPGLRPKEIRSKTHEQAAKILSDRLSSIQQQIVAFDGPDWTGKLLEKADRQAAALRSEWVLQGDKLCDGKRMLEEMHAEYKIRMPLTQFKRRIVRAMARRHAPKLEELKAKIRTLLEA